MSYFSPEGHLLCAGSDEGGHGQLCSDEHQASSDAAVGGVREEQVPAVSGEAAE